MVDVLGNVCTWKVLHFCILVNNNLFIKLLTSPFLILAMCPLHVLCFIYFICSFVLHLWCFLNSLLGHSSLSWSLGFGFPLEYLTTPLHPQTCFTFFIVWTDGQFSKYFNLLLLRVITHSLISSLFFHLNMVKYLQQFIQSIAHFCLPKAPLPPSTAIGQVGWVPSPSIVLIRMAFGHIFPDFYSWLLGCSLQIMHCSLWLLFSFWDLKRITTEVHFWENTNI